MTGQLVERLLLDAPSVQDLMAAAAATAAGPGQSCGVTYRTRYGPVTVASNDARASAVDEVQYAAGDGPCLQAMRTGEPVRVPDLAVERRWGSYPQLALAAGICSSVSFPLLIDGVPVGAMNLYSDAVGPWDVAAEAAAIVAVELLTGVVRSVFDRADTLSGDPDVLQSAADSTLDVAVGLVMAGDGCNAGDAEAQLRGQAARADLSIAQLAQRIVDTRG